MRLLAQQGEIMKVPELEKEFPYSTRIGKRTRSSKLYGRLVAQLVTQ
jgi:hypothetical protein